MSVDSTVVRSTLRVVRCASRRHRASPRFPFARDGDEPNARAFSHAPPTRATRSSSSSRTIASSTSTPRRVNRKSPPSSTYLPTTRRSSFARSCAARANRARFSAWTMTRTTSSRRRGASRAYSRATFRRERQIDETIRTASTRWIVGRCATRRCNECILVFGSGARRRVRRRCATCVAPGAQHPHP